MKGPPVELAPSWEKAFPGLLEYELEVLEKAGASYEIDQEALQQGILKLALNWPRGSGWISLEAVFPDKYPFFRPHVFLKEAPEEWPRKHCSPIDGALCLLGRNTAQWSTSWTLARLLTEQLESAITGTGSEDPQGEPTEVWWNCFAGEGSYCLIQSDWDVGTQPWGYLKIGYLAEKGNPPIFKGVVLEVQDGNKQPLFQWSGMVPPEFNGALAKTITVPWILAQDTLWPSDGGKALWDIFTGSDVLRRQFGQTVAKGVYGFPFAAIYPSELALGKVGQAWVFALLHGPHESFGKAARKAPKVTVLRTYRAGPLDLGFRVPAVASLRSKCVGLVGLGAIGGPTAMELARNGIKRLNLLDGDRVEPGNSIRWPLGASSWGMRKSDALVQFISSEYGWTDPVGIHHQLGGPADEVDNGAEALAKLFDGADIIIDATASFGVTNSIYGDVRSRGLSLLQAYATPPLHGGCVVRYSPTGACPICIEYHRHEGSLIKPPGLGADAALVQPPGCAENTFAGASFDLTEIAMQTVRAALATFDEVQADKTIVYTVAFVGENGKGIAPVWSTEAVPIHPHCGCTRDR